MRFSSVDRRTCYAALILVLVLLLGAATDSQAIERIRVTVGDTTGTAGEQNSVVTVFLTNTMDQIAAFTLHLVLTRNDIANFQNDLDTVVDTTYWREWCCTEWLDEVCVDSAQDTCAVDFPDLEPWDFYEVDTVESFTGNFDTVGTLISGWEMVDARSVSTGELGLDIKLSAIADRQTVPGYKPPISPQQGGVLFRLLADIFPISPLQEDRTVGIIVDVSWKPYFVFSTPEGEAVGWVQIEVPDTNYYMCRNWEPPDPPNPPVCYDWEKVPLSECPGGVCDSIFIDTVGIAVLDTSQVRLYGGSITVLNYICGDCNDNGEITISDIALLIDHLFISGALIEPIERCNTNCSTEQPVVLTISDVAVLIDRLFITGNPMCCE